MNRKLRADEINTLVGCIEDFVDAIINSSVLPIQHHHIDSLNKHRRNLIEYISGLVGEREQESEVKPENVKCPECNGEMMSRKNKTTGQRFWGCKNYPDCRGTRDSNGMSREEREEEKAREENKVCVNPDRDYDEERKDNPRFRFTKG